MKSVAIILNSPTLGGAVTEKEVIFADGGYKHKQRLADKKVVAVIGDFDSCKTPPLAEKVITLNKDKNFTDGERAIRFAKEIGAEEVVIYGGLGGRIDHVLGNIALLKIATELGLSAYIKGSKQIVRLLTKGATTACGKVKGNASLIPYGGACAFAKSNGLHYDLAGLTLTLSDTRGISNVITEKTFTIEVTLGEAILIYNY